MNNERYNQIIGDAYKSYQKEINRRLENWIDIQEGDIYEGTSLDDSGRIWTQEEFINKCKIDSKFSKKWGLKIEERELSTQERKKLCDVDPETECRNNAEIELYLELQNIPTKVITTKYQNETVITYEQ